MSESTMTLDEDTDNGGNGFKYRRFNSHVTFRHLAKKEEILKGLKKIFPLATLVLVVLLGVLLILFSLKPQPAKPTRWGKIFGFYIALISILN